MTCRLGPAAARIAYFPSGGVVDANIRFWRAWLCLFVKVSMLPLFPCRIFMGLPLCRILRDSRGIGDCRFVTSKRLTVSSCSVAVRVVRL